MIQTDRIGKNVTIGEFSVIRSGVTIGDNVIIHPNVILNPGVVLQDGVEVFPGAYLGREPKVAGGVVRIPVFKRQLIIEKNSSIGAKAVIYYDVQIGENTLIGDGAGIREQCKIGSSCIIGRNVEINYHSSVGDRSRVMDSSHITGNCRIGNDVFISMNVTTANDNAFGQKGYQENGIMGPTIQDGAMIGVGAVLLPGIEVGTFAVVGAGAVVTKNVEPHTEVRGVPAKWIRRVDKAEN